MRLTVMVKCLFVVLMTTFVNITLTEQTVHADATCDDFNGPPYQSNFVAYDSGMNYIGGSTFNINSTSVPDEPTCSNYIHAALDADSYTFCYIDHRAYYVIVTIAEVWNGAFQYYYHRPTYCCSDWGLNC
jgi:hypothetical protein